MVSLPSRRSFTYYGGLQNYRVFNHFCPEVSYHNRAWVCHYCKIFWEGMQIYRVNRGHKWATAILRTFPFITLKRTCCEKKDSTLWKMSRCQVFLFIPQSEVRQHLSQEVSSVVAIRCRNAWYQARKNTKTSSGFPPCQWSAKAWAFLTEKLVHLVLEGHAGKVLFLNTHFHRKFYLWWPSFPSTNTSS